jgi:hypothetical protein
MTFMKASDAESLQADERVTRLPLQTRAPFEAARPWRSPSL